MPLRVCFLSAEFAPFSKTGGLGDVSSALTGYLAGAGHELRVFVPRHAQTEDAGIDWEAVDPLQGLEVQVGPRTYRYDVRTARVPGSSLWIYFIVCPELFDRPALYTDAPDEHVRYLMFTRAAFESCQRLGFAPDILHCNDWHTAFAPVLLHTAYAWDRNLFGRTRSVFTIHNIGYQGIFPASRVADLGPSVDPSALHGPDLLAGRINPMRHAILHADAITTVSPTYAREIRAPGGGYGLDADLRARGGAVVGILNGIDTQTWNPARDSFLPHHYDVDDLSGKALVKAALLDLLRLHASPRVPLLGIISRLARQKGIDLYFDTLPEFLAANRVRIVTLGSGDAQYETFFRSLRDRYPGRIVYHDGYSEELAHYIEAAADIFVMPSLYEPCGLNQMYSQRYGTVPVVRRTGGLADSVQHFDPATGSGTGVVFNDFDAAGLRWGLSTALEWYAQPALWQRLRTNGMRVDFSWARSGAEYAKLYERLADGT
jgi:starch synthase